MVLPSDIAQKQVHSVVEKELVDTPYELERLTALTETGGMGMLDSVDQTITTGGTVQNVTAWTEKYKLKVATATIATGIMITTTGTTFTIRARGTIRRQGNGTSGKCTLLLESSKDDVLETFTFDGKENEVVPFDFSHTGALTATANNISLQIGGNTVTGEVFTMSDVVLFLESAA